MKLAAFALLALIPSFASAATLTYKIDLAHSKMDETTAFDMCGLPKEISLDAREDLATVVIQKTQAIYDKNLKIQTIQANGGSMSGGGLVEPYTGAYRTRVALVSQTGIGYAFGVFKRLEVTTYGSTAAPKAFEVNMEILNYRESAELGEDSMCAPFSYVLQN